MTISRTALAAAAAALACTSVWVGRATLRRLLGDAVVTAQELWLRPESLKTYVSGFCPWTCAVVLVAVVGGYFVCVLLFTPMDRVRLLGELGYVPDGKVDMKEMSKLVQRRRQTGDVPPVYPNGWFGILESRSVTPGNVRGVSVLGEYSLLFHVDHSVIHVFFISLPSCFLPYLSST